MPRSANCRHVVSGERLGRRRDFPYELFSSIVLSSNCVDVGKLQTRIVIGRVGISRRRLDRLAKFPLAGITWDDCVQRRREIWYQIEGSLTFRDGYIVAAR